MRKIKLSIRFLYITLSSLITVTCLLYLLLIFLLEYLSYNPQYIEDFIDKNIDIAQVDYVKVKRKGHSLNINIYDMHIDNRFLIPKLQFKLNLIKSLFHKELVFDKVNISQIKIDINNKKILTKFINRKSFNKENLELDIGNIFKISEVNSYINQYLQKLRKVVKKYKFIRNINISSSSVIFDKYKLSFDNIKIKSASHNHKHSFKLIAFAKIIHGKISSNSIVFALNLKSSKHNSTVFSGKIFSQLKNAQFVNLPLLKNKYSGNISSASSLIDIRHNKIRKVSLDLDSKEIDSSSTEFKNLKFNSEYLPNSSFRIKDANFKIINKSNNNFYMLDNGNLKASFIKARGSKFFSIFNRFSFSKFDFNAKQFSINQKNVFRETISFYEIESKFNSFKLNEPEQLNINLQSFSAVHNRATFKTKGAVFFPINDNKINLKSAKFSSKSSVNNIPVTSFLNYLPVYKIDKDVIAWIDSSFLSGNIKKTNIVYRGGFNNDFPFDYKLDNNVNGKFVAEAFIENVTLEYLKNWPSVKDLFGKIVFDTRDISFETYKGYIYSSLITNSHGYIKNMRKNYPNLLHIEGNLKGDSNNIIKYFKNIDHKIVSDEILNGTSLSGKSDLKININEKLGTKIPTKIFGDLRLNDNKLLFKGKDFKSVELDNISGNIKFDNDYLISNDLNLKLFDKNIKLNLNIKDKAQQLASKIDYSAILDQDFFTRFIKSYYHQGVDEFADYLSKLTGESKFRGTFESNVIKDKLAKADFSIHSNLNGLSSNIDYPFNKEKDEIKKLDVSFKLNDSSYISKFDYDSFTVFINESRKSQDVHGKIILNKVSINDLQKVRSFIHNNLSDNKANGKNYFLKLYVNNATYDKEIKLIGTLIKKSKNDKLKHDVLYCNLESLELNDDLIDFYQSALKILHQDSQNQISSNENLENNNFKRFININKIFINNKYIGKLTGDIFKDNANIKLNGKEFIINISKKMDAVKGNLNGKNIGEILGLFGIEKSVDSSNVYMSFDIPNMNSKELKGDLFLMLKNGVINKVDPGLGRLLGAFSFSSFQRKLKLDFSDITKKSYSFDQVIGNFVLEKNKIVSKDVKILGPSADIDISGEFSIKNNTYDVIVDVTPKVSGGVPVAAAIASGNPAVGVIVWAVDKLLQSPFDKISRSRYSVTGSATNPEINKVKIG